MKRASPYILPFIAPATYDLNIVGAAAKDVSEAMAANSSRILSMACDPQHRVKVNRWFEQATQRAGNNLRNEREFDRWHRVADALATILSQTKSMAEINIAQRAH